MTDDFITRTADDFQQIVVLKRYLKGIDGFIAGGAFKNVFDRQPIKDVDIFFPTQAAWAKAVKKFYKRKYQMVYENARVIAFLDPLTGMRLELIGASIDEDPRSEHPVEYGTPEETIARFDFTITKFALFKEGDSWMVVHNEKFFEHLHLKRLVIDADLVKPLSTFERSYRYGRYGFRLCRESKAILIREIQNTEFDDEAQISASFYDGLD